MPSKILMYSGTTTGTTTTGDQYAFFINETGLPTVKNGSQTITFGTNGYAFAGSSGSSGQSGSNGSSGTNGVSGTSGQDGAPGDTGSAGNNGTSGVSGTAGINGVDGGGGTAGSSGLSYGSSGTSGVTGSSGSSGATGSSGSSGATGSSGSSGATGSSGSSGATGSSGSSGATGSSGSSGNSGAGVPTGGTAGQVLAKIDGTNFNTQWVNQSGGGGGTGMTFNQFWSQIVDDLDPHPADPTALEPYSIKISYNAGLASVVNIVDTGNNILKTVYTGTTYTPTLNESTIAFLDATGISQESTTALALDDLVVGLKTNSLWNKILTLYPMVGGTAATHKYNLKDPRDLDAAYRLSFSGGWTHSSSGALPNGTNAYADTYFNPVANSLTTANAHLAYYAGTYASTGDSCEIGNYTNDGIGFVMQCKSSVGNQLRCFFTYSYPAGYASIPRGFVAFSATANTRRDAYVAGTSVGNNTTTDNGTLGNYSLYIGAAHINGASANSYSDALCSLASIGNGLTSGEISTYNTLVAAFQTALSRNV